MEETFYSNTYSRKQKENYYRPQQRTNRSLRLTTVIMISFSNLYSFLTKLEYSYTVSSLLNLNAVKNRLFCTCKVFAQTFENVFVIFFLFADLTTSSCVYNRSGRTMFALPIGFCSLASFFHCFSTCTVFLQSKQPTD